MSDNRTIAFWDQLRARGVGYDSAIFKGEDKIHYADLLDGQHKDAELSFIRAAMTALPLSWGGLDDKFKNKSAEDIAADPALAKEIIDDGRSYISWFNNNIGRTLEIGYQIKANATPEQKLAFLYMMDVHDRLSVNWGLNKDFGTSIKNFTVQGVVTDPATLGSLAVGGLTLGAGGVAGLAERKAAMTASTELVIATLRREGLSAAIREGAEWASERGIAQGMKVGFLNGAITSTATTAVKSTNITINGESIQRQNFISLDTASEIAMGTGMSTVFGGALGGVSYYAPKVSRNLWARIRGREPSVEIKAPTVETPAAARPATEAAPVAAEATAATKTTIETKGPSTTIGATAEPTPGTPAHGKAEDGAGWKFFGSRATPTITSKSGIALPKFQTQTDWLKWWMRRDFSWKGSLKLFSHWAPIWVMPTESRPITRPVIEAVDEFMAQKGIIAAVKELQEKVLVEAENGGNIKAVIEAFTKENQKNLTEFRAGVQELRNFVAGVPDELDAAGNIIKKGHSGYKVIGSPPTGNAFEQAIRAMPLPFLAGEHAKTGLTNGQKKALVKYLDDMIELGADLQNADGKNANQILSNIATGKHTKDGAADSLNGLSKAYSDIYSAHMRLTGKTFKGDKVAVQWKDALARSLQEEYYNNAYQTEIIEYKIARGIENIEMTWQNQVLEYAEKSLAQKDEKGRITGFKWATDPDKTNFFQNLEAMERNGFGHEALYALDELMRRRQMWGGGDRFTLTPAESWIVYFTNKAKYKETINGKPNPEFNEAYKLWADAMIAKAKQNDGFEAGAAHTLLGRFHNNRPNRHFYATQSYPYRMAMRYPGDQSDPTKFGLATPGYNFFVNKLAKFPFQQVLHFYGGAKSSTVTEDLSNAQWKQELNTVWKGEGETAFGVIRRSALRIATGGIVNDLSLNPIKIPTQFAWKVYLPLAAAGVGWDLATGNDISWDSRKDYTAYQLWQTAMLPAKTIAGAANGWWDDWHKDGGQFWNAGAIPGAAHGFGGGVTDVWSSLTGPNVTVKKDQPAPTTNTTPTPGSTAAGGGATTVLTPSAEAELSPEVKASRDKARKELVDVGRETSNLAIEVRTGDWTDARKQKIADLKKKLADLDALKMDFGSDGKEISTTAGNLLNYLQELANTGRHTPATLPTFESQDEARHNKTIRQLVNWHNGVLALNNDVARTGWSAPERKLDLDKWQKDYQSFFANVDYLDEHHKALRDEAFRWQLALIAAQKNGEQPVDLINQQPAQLPANLALAGEAGQLPGGGVPGGAAPAPSGGGRPGGEPADPAAVKAAAAKAAADKKAAEDKAAADKAAADRAAAIARGETPPDETPAPSSSGSTNYGQQFANAAGDFWGGFSNWAKVDEGNDVDRMVGGMGGMLGAAAKGGGSWLKNAYNRMMAKQDGSGRSFLRDAGAGILSIFGMAAFIGPMLDKMAIGKIPLIGSLAKLAALVMVFMVARKGLDSVMSPVTPYTEASKIAMQTDSGRGTYLPVMSQGMKNGTESIVVRKDGTTSLTPVPVTGEPGTAVAQTQRNVGGTPNRTLVGLPSIDPDVDQAAAAARSIPAGQMSVAGNTTFVGNDVACNDDIFQSTCRRDNVIHIARDRFNRSATTPANTTIEAVPHDQAGADSRRLNVKGRMLAPVDGSNALSPEPY